jgi:hypothetical protein
MNRKRTNGGERITIGQAKRKTGKETQEQEGMGLYSKKGINK